LNFDEKSSTSRKAPVLLFAFGVEYTLVSSSIKYKGFSVDKRFWRSPCSKQPYGSAQAPRGTTLRGEMSWKRKISLNPFRPGQGFEEVTQLDTIKIPALSLAAATRRAAKVSLVALLSVALLASFEVVAFSPDPTLREKDIKRGENILSRLRAFERPRLESTHSGQHHNSVEKPSSNLFAEVAGLRASDLKTDLATAIFLYEEAFGLRDEQRGAAFDCESEVRDVYAKLCRESKARTLGDFLRMKARLHLDWAEAFINDYRGIRDAATTAALTEMREERHQDAKFAAEVLKALKALEKEVYDYSTLAELENNRKLARVSFERFAEEVARMLARVDHLLLSLPRSPVFYPLYHARNAYVDGLFWWRKIHRRNEMVVSANSYRAPEESDARRLDSGTVSYTVAIHWRRAIRHTREAANLIETLRSNP
jgi:hypothetical protein